MIRRKEILKQLNDWGRQGKPFVFLIDFLAQNPLIFEIDKAPDNLFWQIPESSKKIKSGKLNSLQYWKTQPVPFQKFNAGFEMIMNHIRNGDTYLLNFTQPTFIETNLSLEEIFHVSVAPYKIYLENEFVCFSPETFVKIKDGKIYSYPMKGTIDAETKNAEELILNDAKEIAEHNTIVDLIRNDLSRVAENVKVDKFRYLSHIKTNQKNLLQVSSRISGELPQNYPQKIGDIIFELLPAGSISGAPKPKTLEIIFETEHYNRGFYTGIFGVFDGKNLDSCVLIRFIENQSGQLVYKSGGGITFMSNAKNEYEELIKKVYVPIA